MIRVTGGKKSVPSEAFKYLVTLSNDGIQAHIPKAPSATKHSISGTELVSWWHLVVGLFYFQAPGH